VIGSLLLLLAGGALELGPSPLAAPGHAHRWAKAHEDLAVTGWIDEAWRSETEIGGKRFKQVLLRTEVKLNAPMVFDTIAVVDCASKEIGMEQAVTLQPSGEPGMTIDLIEVRAAELETHNGDRRIISFACGAGDTRR
jgi:hypothetical protein